MINLAVLAAWVITCAVGLKLVGYDVDFTELVQRVQLENMSEPDTPEAEPQQQPAPNPFNEPPIADSLAEVPNAAPATEPTGQGGVADNYWENLQ